MHFLESTTDHEDDVNHMTQEGHWEKIKSVVDSGCADHVAPTSMCAHVPLRESPGSRRGQEYAAANGGKLENLGEREVRGYNNEGHPIQLVYQVTAVTKPLASVAKICDRGNVVVFTQEGGHILNLTTGVQTEFARENGVYSLDTWVFVSSQQPGFTRHDR